MSSFAIDSAGRLDPARVLVGGIEIDRVTLGEAINVVRDAMSRGTGGRVAVIDPEVKQRLRTDPSLGEALAQANLVVAGSVGSVWGSHLAGAPVPHRISTTELVQGLCEASALDGRRIYLLGGVTGRPGVPGGAQRAAAVLGLRHRGLMIAGCASPRIGVEADPAGLDAVLADVVSAKPELVLVGSDLRGTERFVAALRAELPAAWLLGSAWLIERVLTGGRHRLGWFPHRRVPGRHHRRE